MPPGDGLGPGEGVSGGGAPLAGTTGLQDLANGRRRRPVDPRFGSQGYETSKCHPVREARTRCSRGIRRPGIETPGQGQEEGRNSSSLTMNGGENKIGAKGETDPSVTSCA